MSRILAYTSPALGHLFPMTPLLLELRSRGHHVHVRTLADQVDRMESLGLDARRPTRAIEAIENVDWKAGAPARHWRRSSGRSSLAGSTTHPTSSRRSRSSDPTC